MSDLDERDVARGRFTIGRHYGIDPGISDETRRYMWALAGRYRGDGAAADFERWLEEEIPRRFVALAERPRWIQQPEWPFSEGQPMIFAGQIDIATDERAEARQLFHDDTAIDIFLALGAPPRTIVQQY